MRERSEGVYQHYAGQTVQNQKCDAIAQAVGATRINTAQVDADQVPQWSNCFEAIKTRDRY